MNICYREATPEDAAGIATVEVVSQQAGYREFLPATHLDRMSIGDRTQVWESALQPGNPDRTVVAVHNEEVIGFVRVEKCKDAGIGGITYLFVKPEYWGTGVGQGLMSEATEIMRDFGSISGRLYVFQENARGRHFYERLGWNPDGRTFDFEIEGKTFRLLCYVRTVES